MAYLILFYPPHDSWGKGRWVPLCSLSRRQYSTKERADCIISQRHYKYINY